LILRAPVKESFGGIGAFAARLLEAGRTTAIAPELLDRSASTHREVETLSGCIPRHPGQPLDSATLIIGNRCLHVRIRLLPRKSTGIPPSHKN